MISISLFFASRKGLIKFVEEFPFGVLKLKNAYILSDLALEGLKLIDDCLF